ncbi:MAG: DUF2851 family protein [Verrucomicrobiota bacterium]
MSRRTYAALRLQESTDFVPDEAFVQRLWFEGLARNPLKATDGRKFELIQPGFWNHSAGPDFNHAAVVTENQETLTGPVEIHLTPDAFQSHGHHKDPAYNDLLLHVVWTRGMTGTPPTNASGSSVPVIELSSQLSAPLTEAKACFAALPSELEVGARIGRCQQALSQLPDPETLRLVEEAGWYRFHQRVARWRLKQKSSPTEKLLWQGLCEVFGYSKNREVMTFLSRRLPITQLQRASDTEREALLFGVGGWMNEPASPHLSKHVRTLWDVWWKHRHEYSELEKRSWTLSGTRPNNRPERRLAALAGLSSRTRFALLVEALESADGAAAKDLLLSASHPEWNHRFTLTGKRSEKSQRLIGADRADAFLFNVFWPIAYDIVPEKVEIALKAATTSADSLASRRTKVRLFKTTFVKSLAGRMLATEGLLQIYQDFCLQDRSACGQCEFPEWINQWKP